MLSRDKRRALVRDFCDRHHGRYFPALFAAEVRATGPKHPAWAWFREFDQVKLANERLVDLARAFVRDLDFIIPVETVEQSEFMVVHERRLPFAVSPLAGRLNGEGYILVDPDDPDHREEIARQAAHDLDAWRVRYAMVLTSHQIAEATIQQLVEQLEQPATTELVPV